MGTTAVATAVAWVLPRWLERLDSRVRRGERKRTEVPSEPSLALDPDEPLFGGLLEAA
jgi:hypothetical protein